ETDGLAIGSLTTGDGFINVIVTSGNLDATLVETASGDVALTAIVGAIDADTIIAGNNKNISLTAGTSVSIDDLKSSRLDVTAGNDVTLSTDVDTLTTIITGQGSVTLTEKDDITLETISVVDGSIAVTASDALTVTHVVSNNGDIALHSIGGLINVTKLVAGNSSDATLIAGTTVHADSITASDLILTSGGTATIGTLVDNLTATVSGTGDLTVTETDDITLKAIQVENGTVEITATTGNITAESVATDIGDIKLQSAAGAINAENLIAGNNSNVTLSAATTITADNITANELSVTAGADTDLTATIGTLDVILTGDANLKVAETDSIILNSIVIETGTIDITALTGNIIAKKVETGTGNILLTAIIGSLDIETLTAGNNSDVRLTSGATINADAITANDLVITSVNGAVISTTADTLTAEITDAGDLHVTETDAIILKTVMLTDGEFELITGSNSVNGGISMSDTGHVNADAVIIRVAGGDADLDTSINRLDAVITGTGSLTIAETDTVILTNINNENGSVNVFATNGTISATTITTQSGDVALTADTGSIIIDQLTAGNSSDVILNSALTVTANQITANDVSVNATGDVTLTTDIDTLDTVITGAGNLTVTEKDGITLENINLADGNVTIATGTHAVSGGINMADAHLITANELSVTAYNESVTLFTAIDKLDVAVIETGDITVTETDGLAIGSLTTGDGFINVIVTSGNLDATLVETASGDVALTAIVGAI
ncbi:MAG: S-layer family protein, partial [FCB group bacterium]|nr:S-layer family protein [FCB group bacterium]